MPCRGEGNHDVCNHREGKQGYTGCFRHGQGGIHKSKFKTIFTPGYTTKERGWGGLGGLSLVKRIVEVSHGGKIFVKRSELGKGTTFRIELSKNLKT